MSVKYNQPKKDILKYIKGVSSARRRAGDYFIDICLLNNGEFLNA